MKIGLPAIVLALAACEPPAAPLTPPPPEPPPPSAAPTQGAPAALDFRAKPPPAGPEIPFVPPKIEEARLPNGVRILLVERHELPIVAITIATDHGAEVGAPGIGGFVGAMLMQGTKTRSALQISDELEKLGASAGAFMDYDSAEVSGRCLSNKLDPMMTLLGDITQNPAFARPEIERQRSQRLTSLIQQNDQPGAILSNMVAATIYPPQHPYSAPLLGTEEAVSKVSASDLASLYQKLFQPNHITVALAGDITKDRAVAEVTRVFGKWRPAAEALDKAEAPPSPKSDGKERVILVDRPGATQSYVALTLPGVPRLNKDFDALMVMNTILGGQFSSRLNMNLREKNAYTYGARSGFDLRHGPGPFTAGGPIFREKTGAAVMEMLSELQRIRAELVTEEELSAAQSRLIRSLPARFESASDTSATLASLAVYGLPLDEFATRPARIQRITREDVKRVAETYLPADGLRLIVVGDAKVVKEQLAKVGLGEVTMKTPPRAPSTTPAGAAAPLPKVEKAPKKK